MVSISIVLIVVTVVVVVVVVTHTKCIPASTSTTPEESTSGSADFKPSQAEKKLMKKGTHISIISVTTTVQDVASPATLNNIINWDHNV